MNAVISYPAESSSFTADSISMVNKLKMKNRTSIVLLIIFAASFFSQSGVAAEPSAQEIIQKSKDVMNATMKYEIGIAGSAAITVVYQKALTNGTTVSRYETSAGTVKLTYLFLGNGTFQLFPKAHAAINVSFLVQAGQVPSVNPFAKISPDIAEWRGFTTYKDKTCYKVQAHLTPVDTNLTAMLPANTPVPDSCQYLIETNTYRVLQMTLLHGNSTYGSMEFRNFEALPDLSEDFFIVPSDYKSENAASLENYSHLMMKYLIQGPKNIPKGYAYDPDTHFIVKVDPKTGAFIPLTNAAASSAYQFGTLKSQKTIRIIVLFIMVILSFGFLSIFIISRRHRKKYD
jgi:hypothetical protein